MRAYLLSLVLVFSYLPYWKVETSPTGVIVKHLKNFTPVLKWTKNSPKTVESDGDAPQFENGYFVETLVDGNKLGIVTYTLRVSTEGELFAVDFQNNNIVKITPPLSQYSRARLVAGSFQGHSGHVDGKASDSRFSHPKGVAMDEKGNVYVADTANLAIRKIGESGVTTIAGGKSNVAGYRDGPSEDAKFSNDFDIVYVARTCSLLVVDRGNAALRQISLQQEDCDHQYNSISSSDIVMVVGAILAGYISCLLQHGLENSLFSKTQSQSSKQQNPTSLNKLNVVAESLKEEAEAGWPSPGRLLSDLVKFSLEAFGTSLVNLISLPRNLRPQLKGLSPLKDNLVMPEDKSVPPPPTKHSNPTMTETPASSNINTDSSIRYQRSSKPPKLKDLTKHRSVKRPDFTEFYSTEVSQIGSKNQKDKLWHRQHDKSSELGLSVVGTEPKSGETKPKEYSEAKFGHYNMNAKYGSENTYNF